MTAEEFIINLDKQHGENWTDNSELLVNALNDFAKLSHNKQSAPCSLCTSWSGHSRYTFCPDCGRKLR